MPFFSPLEHAILSWWNCGKSRSKPALQQSTSWASKTEGMERLHWLSLVWRPLPTWQTFLAWLTKSLSDSTDVSCFLKAIASSTGGLLSILSATCSGNMYRSRAQRNGSLTCEGGRVPSICVLRCTLFETSLKELWYGGRKLSAFIRLKSGSFLYVRAENERNKTREYALKISPFKVACSLFRQIKRKISRKASSLQVFLFSRIGVKTQMWSF